MWTGVSSKMWGQPPRLSVERSSTLRSAIKKPPREGRLLKKQLIVLLRNDLRDPRSPVCQLRTSIPAPEVSRHERAERASLVDVFRGYPNRIAVAGSGAIVAPTWPSAELAGWLVASEAIVRSLAHRSNVKVADPDLGVDAGIASAGIEIIAYESETHDSSPALSYRDRRIRQVVPLQTRIALLSDIPRMRIDHEEGDPGSGCCVATDQQTGIQRRPKLAIREHDLLH